MDTENQQWFCDICDKNYSLKRKEKHLLTKVHKRNKERSDRYEDDDDYQIRRDILMMENIENMDFDEFVNQYKRVEKQLKKEFKK